MDLSYLITPFFAWLFTGILKFTINSYKAKCLAFNLIGYGGFPSNHSAIVTSMASIIAFKEGIASPAFGVALTLAFIVMMDANSLRQQIGKQAKVINQLNRENEMPPLRERIGHSQPEILAGIVTGILAAWLIFNYLPKTP